MRRFVAALGVLVLATSFACGRTALEGDSGPGDAGRPECAPLAPAEADQELRDRWNAAVDAVQPLTRDFRWTQPNDFPHPTYRRGDATAYAEFSTVLVRFWTTTDTIDFVRCNELFDKRYAAGPQGQRTFSLREVTGDLSTSPLITEDRRQELEALCETLGC